jgi:hypothetical protein
MASTLGQARGSWLGLCSVGSREMVGRDGASPLGVGNGGGIKEKREERVLAGRWPRAPPLSRVQLGNDKEKIFAKI